MQVKLKDGSIMAQGFAPQDVEIRLVGENNTKMANFSLIVEKDENDNATFVNCIAFGKAADATESIAKGDSIFVVGKIDEREYTNKEGVSKTSKKLKVDFLSVMGSFSVHSVKTDYTSSQSPQNQFRVPEEDFFEIETDGDLPF